MQKIRLFFTRMLLTIMLSCSLIPLPAQIQELPQHTITAEAGTRYNKATIKKVQKKLNDRSYNCGTPDGISGSKTAKAIRQYQKDHDLKVTGTVNSQLLKSLNITPVKESDNSTRSSNTNELTVYITNTGKKYHRSGCRYLSRSKHAISKSNAQSAGYGACLVCNP